MESSVKTEIDSVIDKQCLNVKFLGKHNRYQTVKLRLKNTLSRKDVFKRHVSMILASQRRIILIKVVSIFMKFVYKPFLSIIRGKYDINESYYNTLRHKGII